MDAPMLQKCVRQVGLQTCFLHVSVWVTALDEYTYGGETSEYELNMNNRDKNK